MSAQECQWWWACKRPAATTRSAPWGDVPICERCAQVVDQLEGDPRAKRARRAAEAAKRRRSN